MTHHESIARTEICEFIYRIARHLAEHGALQMDDLIMAVVASLTYLLILRGLSPIMHWYERIEGRFLENMNKRQMQQSFVIPEVLQENFALEKMTLSPKSRYAGMTIGDSDFRDAFNVSVVSVERAEEAFDLPHPDFMLFPMDEVTFVGSEEHLAKLRPHVEIEDDVLVKERAESDVNIYKSVVQKDSRYLGLTLQESGIRDRYNAMVIAFERNGDFILTPPATITFQEGDTVWFVVSESTLKTMEMEAVVSVKG